MANRAACFFAAFVLLLAPAAARSFKSDVVELDKMVRVHPEYPIPAEPHQLFYVERSSNSNTVVYCAKLGPDGKLDPKQPVVGYWRWYNRGGYIKQLNLPEQMMAYGIKSVKHEANGSYSFRIAAFPDRILYVGLDDNGRPEAYGKLGSRSVRLDYVYLVVDDTGILPDVPEADFYAWDRETGKPVREHLTKR